MKNILLLIIYLIVFGIFYNNLLFFESNLGKGIICMIMLILFFIDIKLGLAIFLTVLTIYKYQYQYETTNIHGYIINLDKNKNRYISAIAQCESSDLNGAIHIDRFSAIKGKTLILHDYLNEDIIDEIKEVEEKKNRTHHHQLTRGGLGCFLSHLQLYRNLLDDDSYNTYLIMEDDIEITKNIKTHIDYSLKKCPNNWDIILYTWIRLGSQPTINSSINKVEYFWGMQCYIINNRGAKKIVDEIEKTPIDGQIDSYLSRMIKQEKLNVYAYDKKIVNENSNQTDIQIDLQYKSDIDPFDYNGYIMR